MAPAVPGPARRLRARWERLSVYIPVFLMGLLALATYWLVRNTPGLDAVTAKAQLRHDPDAYMRNFSVKTFDAGGRLKSEVQGAEARHYPDTDTLEIDTPRIRVYNALGQVTVATGQRGISNADGSELQLLGDAVVTRDAVTGPQGQALPRMQIRSEFLHVFVNTEKIRTNKPVEISRGDSRFTAQAMDYDNLTQLLDLRGEVHGELQPRRPGGAR